MKNRSMLLRFFLLLSKRFLRNGRFLVMLSMIPLFALFLALISEPESGVIAVAVYNEAESGLAEVITGRLSDSRIIRVERTGNMEEARTLLRNRKADAVLVFPESFDRLFREAAAGKMSPLAEVTVQEDNVLMKLLREKLFTSLYPELSRGIFDSYIRMLYEEAGKAGSDAVMPDEEELSRYFLLHASEDRLIVFETPEGSESDPGGEELVREGNYLVFPFRGLLALFLTVLAGTASLFLEQDLAGGLTAYLPPGLRTVLPFLYPLSALLLAAPFTIAALFFSGAALSFPRELLLYVLFLLSLTVFTELLRNIFYLLSGKSHGRTALLLALALPVRFFLLLLLCPVFINFKTLKGIQQFLPAWHLLESVSSGASLRQFAAYTGILVLLAVLLLFFRKYFRKTD